MFTADSRRKYCDRCWEPNNPVGFRKNAGSYPKSTEHFEEQLSRADGRRRKAYLAKLIFDPDVVL